MKYKIINLVREDFNKSVVFYNTSSEKVKEYYKKFYDWLNENTESDLYANFKKNDAGKIILQDNMACIDILVDDNWWSDSDLEKVLEEIIL
jgi:hypothetical protein